MQMAMLTVRYGPATKENDLGNNTHFKKVERVLYILVCFLCI